MIHPFKLSVVIPTYCEMHRLPQTLTEILPYLEKNFKDYEIIFVDDASADGTSAFIKSFNNPKFHVIDQPGKIGKGAAITAGCLKAEGDYILYMDADHATPIEELENFIPLALK